MITKSDNINELAAAMSVAQGLIEGAKKDSANPFFKSKYADLGSVWDAIREPLAKNGLSVVQCPSANGATVAVTTLLLHNSGQWISSDLTVTAREDTPQAVGSAITYARRYALQSVCGVAPEDDDGEAAQGRPREKQDWNKGVQAAQEVAKKKIADLQKQEPKSTSSTAETQRKQMVEMFEGIGQKIGEAEYFKILGAHGFESVKDIQDINMARAIFKEMQAEYNEQGRSRGVA